MDYSAPQGSLNQLETAPLTPPATPQPSKNIGRKRWLVLAICLLALILLGAFAYRLPLGVSSIPIPANLTNTVRFSYGNPTNYSGKIFYDRETRASENNQNASSHTLYQNSPDGTDEVALVRFTTDKPSTVELLNKIRWLVFTSFDESKATARLLYYDLTKGKVGLIYESDKGFTIGSFSFSPDGTKIAIGVEGPSDETKKTTRMNVILSNLLDQKATIIKTGLWSRDSASASAQALSPLTWLSDGRTIVIDQKSDSGHLPILLTNESGQTLKSIDFQFDHSPSGISPDGNKAVTHFYKWIGGSGSCTSASDGIGYLDLVTQQTVIISRDQTKGYSNYRWSPDSQQFLYGATTLPTDPDKCISGPTTIFIYDLASKSSTEIASFNDQVKKWYPNEPKVESGEGLKVNGHVITTDSRGDPLSSSSYLGYLPK